MPFNNKVHIKQFVCLSAFALLYGYLSYKAITSESILLMLGLPGLILIYYFYDNPVVCFWTILYSAMLAGVAVSYVPGMFNFRWGINLLALLLGISMMLKIFLRHPRVRFRSDPVFFFYTVLLLYAVLFSLINGIPTKQIIIALKNNFQFYPVLLFFLIYPLHCKFPSQLVKAISIIALIQPPIVLFQYFFIVPKLKYTTGVSSSSVLDAVCGSFGTSLSGGGTGTYTLFTCAILCGLMTAYNKKMISTKKWILLSIYFLFPMFLNETKAAFLFLLLGSFVAIGLDRSMFAMKKILMVFFAVLLGSSMIWATIQMSIHYNVSPQKLIKQTLAYTSGDVGYGKYRLNRMSCLTFWWQKNKQNPVQLFIGHGLDSTIESDVVSLSTAGSVARRYPQYGTGLTTASQMLWETGLAGFLIFMAIFFSSFRECIKLARSTILSAKEQLIAIWTATGLSLTIMIFFYNSSFRNSQPANMFIILLLSLTILLKLRYQEKTS